MKTNLCEILPSTPTEHPFILPPPPFLS